VQNRRDLLQAYRFQARRAIAALVTGQPNVAEPPMRRLTLTTISGVVIAVLVAVGFALFGILRVPADGSGGHPVRSSWETKSTAGTSTRCCGRLAAPAARRPSSG
jgi:hypothetical protein